jgi:ribose 5-phosphate isomerase A
MPRSDDRPEPAGPRTVSDIDALKRAAAAEALTRVRSGMRLGLGTGSTVSPFLDLLGAALDRGDIDDIVGVPTSLRTADHARRLGIRLVELDDSPLDLAVDGADEVDPDLNLIKGMGGALLREKIVVQAARRFVVIVDGRKEVERLGQRSAVPVEVVPFGWKAHVPVLEALGATVEFRRDEHDRPAYTDNGNIILDCHFELSISDPVEVERRLEERAGVVATGLFLGLATEVLVADPAGVRSRVREAWAR